METRDAVAANEQWQRHNQDEARARAAQQQSAGGSHRPVNGPPPYGNEVVNAIAADIVQREREHCARLVEAWPVGGDGRKSELLRQVAEGIRRQP